MGMFDWVICEVPLPDSWVPERGLQSKDLDCTLAEVRISAEGRLLEKQGADWRDLGFHGDFNFYGDEEVGDKKFVPIKSGGGFWRRDSVWHEYTARFTEGQLVRIVDETAQGMSASGQDPQGLEAKPASPVGKADAP